MVSQLMINKRTIMEIRKPYLFYRDFEERLEQIGLPDVYTPRREHNENVINLGNLHRITLHALQKILVDEVSMMQQERKVDKEQNSKGTRCFERLRYK